MIKKKKNGIEWLEFAQLQPFPHVKHGVFPKQNGDLKSDHAKRDAICSLFGIEHLPQCQQVHQDAVVHIKEGVSGKIGVFDGAITQLKNVGLPILHADCQAALFFDPLTNTIANVHSGWRGSVSNIYQETIRKLIDLGVNPRNLLVSISPSLGPKHAQFIHYKEELPQSFLQYQCAPSYFDFWELSKQQLMQCGVLKGSIELANICTYEESTQFFSYRRGKDRERNMTVIALI
jgi:polyphenol oxidase